MTSYIDADALYERTAEWEASALSKIEELNRIPLEEMTDEERAEWRRWTAILGERTAFKNDVTDAPTADVVEVVRCKDCKFWGESLTKEKRNECGVYADLVCTYWMSDGLTRDDFCSKGERREDATD